jgi:hypothetical protein
MRRLLPLVALLAVACVGTSEPASGDLRSCAARPYSYAGFAATQPASGVSATVTSLSAPQVLNGHVAAWVGVGGPGAGPGGSDEWLQVGLSSFAGGEDGRLYYELALPNQQPKYVEIDANVAPGESHRLTVLEIGSRPSWWRVWIDGRPATPPVDLPQSHNRWRPIATAESWNAGTAVCNAFAYRFGNVAAAAAGRWITFARGYRFQDPGYRVVADSSTTFRALGN